MKKLILFFVGALTLMSCDIDEGVNTQVQYAEVSDIDLPEFFELGEVYDIEVTYLLPTGCHSTAGIDVRRINDLADRWEILVAGVASYDANAGECTRDNTNPERTETFTLRIDEETVYAFHLWTGMDNNNQPIFTIVEVPVGAPSEESEEVETEG